MVASTRPTRTPAKAAPAAAAARKSARTPAKTTRAASPTPTADALAGELDRILTISKANPATAPKARTTKNAEASSSKLVPVVEGKPRPAARSKAAPIASATKPSRAVGPEPPSSSKSSTASRVRPTPAVSPQQPSASSSKAQSTTAKPSTSSRPPAAPKALSSKPTLAPTTAKSKPLVDLPMWAQDGAETSMSTSERSRAVMTCINGHMRDLGLAVKAGYRKSAGKDKGSTSNRSDKAPEVQSDWSDERVGKLLDETELGVQVLRSMVDEPKGKVSRLDVERAGQALVLKLLSFGMWDRVMKFQIEARRHILKLYEQSTTLPTSKTTTKPAATAGKTPSARSVSSSKLAKPSTTKERPPLPAHWLDMLAFPPATNFAALHEATLTVIFQSCASAWMCILNSAEMYNIDLQACLPFPAARTPGPSDPLHPLTIACALPRITTTGLINNIYRPLYHNPALHEHTSLRQLLWAVLTIYVSTTPSDPPPSAPSVLWGGLHRYISARLSQDGAGIEDLQQLSGMLKETLEWIEYVIEARKEDQQGWFSGTGWLELQEPWIMLSRKLKDQAMVRKLLDVQKPRPPVSIVPSTPPSKPSVASNTPSAPRVSLAAPSPMRPSLPCRQSSRTRKRILDAETAISRAMGELASVQLVLEKQVGTSSPLPLSATLMSAASPTEDGLVAGAESSLLSSDLVHLSDALLSLGKGSDAVDVVKKAIRAIERVRHQGIKIYDAASKKPSGGLGAAAEKWLISYLDLAEDQLEESSIISDNNTYDLATGAVDGVLCLLRPATGTAAHESALLDRGRRICDLASPKMTAVERADLLRCLFSSAYNIGVKYWKGESWANAHKFSDLSCRWAEEALAMLRDLPEDQQAAAAKTVGLVREVMAKRYEFVACALQKLGNREAAMSNLILSLAAQSPKIIAILEGSTPTAALAPVIVPRDGLSDLGYTIARISNIIIADSYYPEAFAAKLQSAMEKAKVPETAAGIIVESLFAFLEDGQYKPEVAAMMLDLGDVALHFYAGDGSSTRRLRMLTRLLNLLVTSGQCAERFEGSASDAEALASSLIDKEPSANFAREYRAVVLVLRALRSYHAQSDPSSSVLKCGNAALDDLRGMIIPATETASSPKREAAVARPSKKTSPSKAARAPKTPARRNSDPKRPKLVSTPSSVRRHVSEQAKPRGSLAPSVYDDLPRLVKLLDGLTSLLGMMGHSFARIDCLKTVRGLLRNQEDMLDQYVLRSGELAAEYAGLGKETRAGIVFAQALEVAEDNSKVSGATKTTLLLRYSAYLVGLGKVDDAIAQYSAAEKLEEEWTTMTSGRMVAKTLERADQIHRSILARCAINAITTAQSGMRSSEHHEANYGLWWKISDLLCRLASTQTNASATKDDDPFAIPDAPKLAGQDEPAKDAVKPSNDPAETFKEKRLFCLQWYAAEGMFNALMDLVNSYTARGSVKDAVFYLYQASALAQTVKSTNWGARVNAQWAHFDARQRNFEQSSTRLEEASSGLADEGPDAIELRRIQGDIFTRIDRIDEAAEVFQGAEKDIVELDGNFVKLDARLSTPRKAVVASGSKEVILPGALQHVLRQRAWAVRQGGNKDTVESLLARLQALGGGKESKAEEHYLRGRVQLFSALEQFKTDLFMSSLTESTIAMPMNITLASPRDRASSRLGIAALLDRADDAFRSAVEMFGASGAVEDVRQARLNLALLHAFQTSLQNGSTALTGAAANILASNCSITLQRELWQVINAKFKPATLDAVTWPLLSGRPSTVDADEGLTDAEREKSSVLQTFWRNVQAREAASMLPADAEYDLSVLPSHWAVISINVTDDHNTMFISRHQRDHEPLVFCLPLDRQGRREGEDEEELFTFDVALAEMKDIIATSDATSRNGKNLVTAEEKHGWWDTRRSLNQRMEELLLNIEYVWLGPFKTILSPRGRLNGTTTSAFRDKIQKIFTAALSSAGSDTKKAAAVSIPEPLMECFATLSNKCKDEEVEDLVYFILDIYQFHGVPVAIAELDIDQLGIDVRGALLDNTPPASPAVNDEEHLFLVLDRNVAGFPWESIPSLRGRPVSRIPGLPFLLDQVNVSRQLRQLSATSSSPPSSAPMRGMKRSTDISSGLSRLSLNPTTSVTGEFRHIVNARKVFYILNPSGDLSNTQTHFEGWLNQMVDTAGWKGIVGRPPTELELSRAYQDYDLVLYFGHGGAEQYIRSAKVKSLASCATTMLWGCSSGALADQGDLDRHGTPWNYVMAGCPSLVANLWDVTDRDIDRLSEGVIQKLHLDISHVSRKGPNALPISEMSIVQAVNRSRRDCKFHYLTGAAPVVYGLPAYFH